MAIAVTVITCRRLVWLGDLRVLGESKAPGLGKQNSKLITQVTAQKVSSVIEGVSRQLPEEPWDYRQHFKAYYRVEELKENDAVVGLRYFYKGMSPLHSRYCWRVRVRHIIERGSMKISLPPPPNRIWEWDTVVINDKEPGWVYGKL